MALTKTIQYEQGVPTSLGFDNELTGQIGQIEVIITSTGRVGNLITGTYGESTSSLDETKGEWRIRGTQADVNEALNNLEWQPGTFKILSEDNNSLGDTGPRPYTLNIDENGNDNTLKEDHGETIIMLANDVGLSIGDVIPFKSGTLTVVGEIATDMSEPIHIVVSENLDTDETIQLYDEIQNIGTTYIVDIQRQDTQGEHELLLRVYNNDNNLVSTDTVTLSGRSYVGYPSFETQPEVYIDYDSLQDNETTNILEIAKINEHDDTELLTVDLLIKRHPQDTYYTERKGGAHPDYVVGNAYGKFTQVYVGKRKSEYPGNQVHWRFKGTASECNEALRIVKYTRPSKEDIDIVGFYLELRVIDGFNRLYNNRGNN